MKTHSTLHSPTTVARQRGFSLVEVMVAVIIIAVGMLGIAKMQALGLSTTESSGTRSLVAIETASLAASMHTNRDYWVSGPPPPSFTVAFGAGATPVITDPTSTLNVVANCASTTPCTPAQLAAYDVQQWGAALTQLVPVAQATVACNNTLPQSCTIQIQWAENVASTSNSAAAASSGANTLNSPTYTLYVEP